MNEIDTRKERKYMASARILRWGPNATYIPLTRVGVFVGGNTTFSICVGGNANFSIFRYQHVGIANANFRVWGLTQREAPTPVVLRRSGI